MNKDKLLVVVDMQNDFIDGALGSVDAQDIVDKVANKIDKWDGRIIYTQDTHLKDYDDTAEGRFIPVRHCIYSSDGWQLHPEIKKRVNNIHLEIIKDSFGSTEPASIVKKYDIKEVVIVGLCTDICVISNALMLRSMCPTISITVDASCCAGTSKEAHNAALLVMSKCAISVINKGA